MSQHNQETKSQAREAVSDAQEKASELTHEAKAKAREMAGQAQEKVKAQAQETVNERKEQAAHELDSVASAVRQSGEQFRDQEMDFVAQYTDRFADQVEGLSNYVNNSSLEEMIEDAEDLGRRQPELFLAGAFALGILAGRFFKSSSRQSRRSRRFGSNQNFGRDTSANQGYGHSNYGYDYDRVRTSQDRWDSNDSASVESGFHREPLTRPTTSRDDLPVANQNRENDFTSHTGDRPDPILEKQTSENGSNR